MKIITVAPILAAEAKARMLADVLGSKVKLQALGPDPANPQGWLLLATFGENSLRMDVEAGTGKIGLLIGTRSLELAQEICRIVRDTEKKS